jgi:flagellar motor switch protein FliN/FliY
MTADITPRDALMRLGASTAEAIAKTLEMFAPGGIERGDVTIIGEGVSPFASLPFGGIAASISYVDGVTGANVFIMTPACARALAAAMGAGGPEDEEPATDLTELEMSAVGEAANQMLAGASAAISVVIGQEIAISTPDVRILDDTAQATEIYGTAPHACSTSFTIAGESCRLVQLVPSAFVVRMARAIDELSIESAPAADDSTGHAGTGGGASSLSLTDALSDITLRVWAELGRTQLALGQALELPIGAVVDLDRSADAPVDLFVNGLCFGHGYLLVTDDGEWAIQVQELSNPAVRKPALAGGAPAVGTP